MRERGDLHGEVTIRGGDQVGHDGDDDIYWPVRSCLTQREVPPRNASNARMHHLANMWMWFIAGLPPVAVLLHTVCVTQSSLFCLMWSTACMFFLYALFFIRVEPFRRLMTLTVFKIEACSDFCAVIRRLIPSLPMLSYFQVIL